MIMKMRVRVRPIAKNEWYLQPMPRQHKSSNKNSFFLIEVAAKTTKSYYGCSPNANAYANANENADANTNPDVNNNLRPTPTNQ